MRSSMDRPSAWCYRRERTRNPETDPPLLAAAFLVVFSLLKVGTAIPACDKKTTNISDYETRRHFQVDYKFSRKEFAQLFPTKRQKFSVATRKRHSNYKFKRQALAGRISSDIGYLRTFVCLSIILLRRSNVPCAEKKIY